MKRKALALLLVASLAATTACGGETSTTTSSASVETQVSETTETSTEASSEEAAEVSAEENTETSTEETETSTEATEVLAEVTTETSAETTEASAEETETSTEGTTDTSAEEVTQAVIDGEVDTDMLVEAYNNFIGQKDRDLVLDMTVTSPDMEDPISIYMAAAKDRTYMKMDFIKLTILVDGNKTYFFNTMDNKWYYTLNEENTEEAIDTDDLLSSFSSVNPDSLDDATFVKNEDGTYSNGACYTGKVTVDGKEYHELTTDEMNYYFTTEDLTLERISYEEEDEFGKTSKADIVIKREVFENPDGLEDATETDAETLSSYVLMSIFSLMSEATEE